MPPHPHRADVLHATLLLLAAAFTAAYWLTFFTTGAVHTSTDTCYLAFERAFPLADAYMAVCLVLAAILLIRGRPAAILWGIAAGSALIYLGCMDTLYNLEHGKYAHPSAAMLLESAINLGSFALGPVTIVRLWRARGRLGLSS